MTLNTRSSLSLSVALNVCLILVCGCLAHASWNYYARSLVASLSPVAVITGEPGSSVLFLGDSRIAKWADHDVMDALYVGLPGATSWQIRNFLSSADLGDLSKKTVILQFGVNDLRLLGVQPQRASEIVSQVVSNIRYVAEELSQASKQVHVLTVFPVEQPGLIRSLVWSPAIERALDSVNEELLRTPTAETVSVLDATLWIDRVGGTSFADTLHLNAVGYASVNAGLRARYTHALQ